MGRMPPILLSLILSTAAVSTPAQAQDGLCAPLRALWTAVKQKDLATVRRGLGEGWQCTVPEKQDIICNSKLQDAGAAQEAYAALRISATSCMALLGLKPSEAESLPGENTLLDTPDEGPGVIVGLEGRFVTLIVASHGD